MLLLLNCTVHYNYVTRPVVLHVATVLVAAVFVLCSLVLAYSYMH